VPFVGNEGIDDELGWLKPDIGYGVLEKPGLDELLAERGGTGLIRDVQQDFAGRGDGAFNAGCPIRLDERSEVLGLGDHAGDGGERGERNWQRRGLGWRRGVNIGGYGCASHNQDRDDIPHRHTGSEEVGRQRGEINREHCNVGNLQK